MWESAWGQGPCHGPHSRVWCEWIHRRWERLWPSLLPGTRKGICQESSGSVWPRTLEGLTSWKFSSVAQSCLTLCDPMDCSTPASLSITNSRSLLKLMSVELVMPSNHLILCRPLLFLPLIFLSIRVFSNESAVHTRWPKFWGFNFSMSPSNEYSGLISFRID